MPHDPIVSKNIRLRHPDLFSIGRGSVVDDFCYFSTRLIIGRCCHIGPGSVVAGGKERTLVLGDFVGFSAGVKVYCTSDDYETDILCLVPSGFGHIKEGLLSGDVTFERFTGIGAGSVVMPGNTIPEGTTIGALSYVPPQYEFSSWTVYAGIPIRPIKARNRDTVMRQVEAMEEQIARRNESDNR